MQSLHHRSHSGTTRCSASGSDKHYHLCIGCCIACHSGNLAAERGCRRQSHGTLLLGTSHGSALDIDKRRALVAQGEKILQDDAVTIQPYWRALANHTVEGLEGGAHHISFEIRPAELHWT